SSRMRASSAGECAMCRMVICSGTCMLAPPVDAYRVIILPEVHIELAVIGALERLADAACGMHVAGCDYGLVRRLGDVHDPIQRMLGTLALGRVAGKLQQLGAMRVEERARQRDDARRKVVAGAGAGGTRCFMGLRRRLAPRPAPAVQDRTAAGAYGGFPILAFGVIGILPQVVKDAVAIARDASRRGIGSRGRMSSCHDSRIVLECRTFATRAGSI